MKFFIGGVIATVISIFWFVVGAMFGAVVVTDNRGKRPDNYTSYPKYKRYSDF